MTISIPTRMVTNVGAYHQREPRIPFEDDAPEGFMVTVGMSNAWLSKEDAARLGRYLLDEPEAQ